MTNKRKKGFLASILAGALALVGCSSNESSVDEVRTPPKELPVATIVFKDFGTVEAELYPHIAPNTVNNFIELSNSGFYDGLTFHRVIKDFMVQGGDPAGTGMGGPGYSIKGEFTKNKFKNDLAHTEGVLSMARSQSKDSAGSQFFIVTKDASHLDGQYASFGKVTKGMDIIHKIENVETGANDKPVKDVVIESIKVDTKGVEYPAPNKM
ncbi:peptidylprolyl isomerase [Romboutsia lituseburensis]|uniref:Peptidyl-prolyl cis-trans isomerase n=1 Tax=Romboutsia lituseburensis DSM 797 TaxID=1121325 RepID=A0A1G9LZ11_9FIRM|nr:peptidylprolyl isomerase [Romboutsia lituseburensis]CEH34688.1 Peptidyl-prolyl cis-trans isomerase [Romboutsia lituseburensis]SDL67229.1 peptidyl-prolyl cis-trans isomerase B (cyclophilin B) [Romboutsia lituseburensis DSM 797]